MLIPNVERYMTRGPYAIAAGDNLLRAKSLMQNHAIRHLPVVSGTDLVGVVSDRDIAVLEAVPGVVLAHVEAARVMAKPLAVRGQDSVDEVSALMADNKCDCVVVQRGAEVVGIFTATDALQALADIVRRACA
jgi:acetoin utilization protein AcuB